MGYIIAFYNLSQDRHHQWMWLAVLAIAQIVLIIIFHTSLEVVVNVMIGIMVAFFVISIIFAGCNVRLYKER